MIRFLKEMKSSFMDWLVDYDKNSVPRRAMAPQRKVSSLLVPVTAGGEGIPDQKYLAYLMRLKQKEKKTYSYDPGFLKAA